MKTMSDLDHLLIRVEPARAEAMLAHWSWHLDQPFRPVVLSAFGDWFLQDEGGNIHMLDLASGDVKEIANSIEEFWACLEEEEHRKEWLMSHVVEALREAGITRADAQCYAFQTPPVLGGQVSMDNIVVWDLEAYQSGTSKVLQQVLGLPPGTEIVAT